MTETEAAPAAFNLIDESWIPVLDLDGSARQVSIRALFREADRIREIGGELPTQTFAIVRLLTAILYRATIDESRPSGWTEEDLREFWTEGLPLDAIDAYLDHVHERFWLLHPELPFFQVAGLATGKGEVKDTAGLILDLPSNNRLFTNRSGRAALELPFDEAARWLVNAQAFDPSGIKSGAVGDPRVKGGKGYPIGLAWSGLLGGLLLEGANLAQTLLLQFVVPGVGAARFAPDPRSDLPPWEDESPDGPAERAGLLVQGPVRLFTWQSRRIRLVAREDRIVGCVLTNGDALTPQNRFAHESMTAWRFSDPQTKRAGQRVFMPREHRADRAFWRGISALLPQREGLDAKSLASATLEAVEALRERGILSAERRLGVRAIGVVYGSNNSVVDDVIDDRLDLPVALLGPEHAALAAEAENAVALADSGVGALRRLAGDLARAAGGDGEAQRGRAGERAYAELGRPYRDWLASLAPQSDPIDAITVWRETARRLLLRLGGELVAQAGPAAWVGREVRLLSGSEYLTTAVAEARFRRALRSVFGASASEPAATPVTEETIA